MFCKKNSLSSGMVEFSEASSLSTLVDNLFQNYHNDVRPVCDSESTVQVRLGLALRQIVDLVSRV